eukprot:564349_1
MSDDDGDTDISAVIQSLQLCASSKLSLETTFTMIKERSKGTNEKVDEVKKEVDHIKARIGDSTDGYDETSLHSKLKGTKVEVDGVKDEVIAIKNSIGELGSSAAHSTLHVKINIMQHSQNKTDEKVDRVEDEVGNIKSSIRELKKLFEKSRGPTLSLADKEFIDNMVLHGESDRIRVVNFLNSLNISISQASIRVKSEGDGAGFITVLPGNEGQIGVKADEINVCVMRSGQTQFGTVKISNLRKNTHAITGLQATENINIDAVSIAKENEITLLPETLVLNDDSAVVDIRYGNSSECAEGVKLCGFKLGSNCMTDVQACLKKIKSGDGIRYLVNAMPIKENEDDVSNEISLPRGDDPTPFVVVLPEADLTARRIYVFVVNGPDDISGGRVDIITLRDSTTAITGLQATEDITICGDSIVNENEITLFPHTLKSNNDRVKVVDIRYGYFSQYVEDVPLDEFKLGNNCRTDVEAFVQKLIQSEDRVRYLTGVLSVQGSKLVPTDPADGGGVPTPFIVVEGDVDDNLSYDGHKLHVCVVNGPDGCDTSGMVDILALRDNTTAIRTLKVGDAAINLGDPGAVANAGAVITLNRETLSLDGTVVKVEVSIIDGVQDMEIALEVLKLDKNVELGEVDKFIRDDIKRGDRIRYLTGNLTVYKVSDMKSHEEQIDAANDEDPAVLAVVMPGTEDRLVGDDRDGIAVFMLHTGGNLLRRVFVKIGELKRCTKAVGTLRVIGSGVGLAIRDGDVVALMPETLRLDGNDVVEVDVIVSTGDVDSFPVVKIDLKDLILGESAQDKNVKLNLETDQVIRDILRGGRIRFLTNKLTVYTNVDMESDDKEIDAADDTNPAVLAVVMPGAEDRLVGEHRNGIAVFLLHTDQDAVQHVFVKIDELKDATKAITEPMTVTNSAIPVSPVNSTIKFEETSLSVDNKNSAVVNVIAGRGTSADDVWTWERSVRVFNSVRLIMFQVYVSGDSVTCKIVKPPGGVELQHFN